MQSCNNDSLKLQPWRGRRLLLPVCAALLAFCLIPWAASIYRFLDRVLDQIPLSSFFSTAVQFTSVTMITGLVLLIWIFDRPKRHLLVYLLAGLLMAGALNAAIKEISGRARPEWSVDLDSKHYERLIREAENRHKALPSRKVLRSDRWLWFSADRPYFLDRYASFPSGHACSAFVTAAFLCVLYPQARLLWLIAALGCALARVRFARHFPEDALVGGALGWSMAQWAFSWCWPMRLGQRLGSPRGRVEEVDVIDKTVDTVDQ